MNTSLEYLYRDASNYKQHGSVVLEGAISLKDIRHLRPIAIVWQLEHPMPAGLLEANRVGC